MRCLSLVTLCLFVVPVVLADEPDPEPVPAPDEGIRKLDQAIRNDKVNAEAVRAQRNRLVAQIKKLHANLVKAGKKDEAMKMKERLLLAESLDTGRPLDSKLTVSKLLEKASSDKRYRELLHVLYVPQDKVSYSDFRDYGMSATGTWGGYNNLTTGYWVYHYPRWYIWKEIKP